MTAQTSAAPARSPVDRITWWTAVRRSELPPTARLVALVLSTYMDPSGARCWPAQTTVAEGAGLGRRTVQRALGELHAGGFLEVRQYGGPGTGRGQRPHVYVPTIPDLCATGDAQERVTSAPPDGAEDDATSAPLTTTSAPLTTDQCATGDARPHQDPTRDLTNDDDARVRAREAEPVDNRGGVVGVGDRLAELLSRPVDAAAIDQAASPSVIEDGWEPDALAGHLAEVVTAREFSDPVRNPTGFVLAVLGRRPEPAAAPDPLEAAARFGRNAGANGVTPDDFTEMVGRQFDDAAQVDAATRAHRQARQAAGLETFAERTASPFTETRRF